MKRGFSGAVLVERAGEVLLHEGYGGRGGRPLARDAGFWVGSVTKPFAATGVTMLAHEGRLSLQDSLAALFANVPADKRSITVHQLLTHTSGLGERYAADGEPDRTRAIDAILSTPLVSPPGTRYTYSNDGYSLLAAIIEIRSGMPYERFMRERLLEPAGMRESGFWGEPEAAAPGVVASVRRQPRSAVARANWGYRGATGLRSTVGDLHRWHVALRDSIVATGAVQRQMYHPHVRRSDEAAYGYGWQLRTRPGERRVGHTGAESGIEHHAALLRGLDQQFVIAFGSNAPEELSWEVLRGVVALVTTTVAPPDEAAGDTPQQWYDSLHRQLAAGDVAAAVRALDPAFVETEIGGRTLSRTDREVAWRGLLTRYAAIAGTHTTLADSRVDGDSAVTTANLAMVVHYRESDGRLSPMVLDELVRDTWRRQGDRWLLSRRTHVRSSLRGEALANPLRSARLRELAEAVAAGDLAALGSFWSDRSGKGPLVEPIAGDTTRHLVTFLWRGGDETVRAGVFGGVPAGAPREMRLLAGTDVWYASVALPSATRTTYGIDVHRTYPDSAGGVREFIVSVPDPLNPRELWDESILELPGATPAPYHEVRAEVRRGALSAAALRSAILGQDRPYAVYTPPGYATAGGPFPLVVLLDGETYGAGQQAFVPTPVILDNLIAERRIPPVVAVLVHSLGGSQRMTELAASPPFTAFLARELIPAIRRDHAVAHTPGETTIGGSSLGGLAAMHAALSHPDVFGNVISQSGAFHMAPQILDTLIARPRVPVRIWMEVGLWEGGNPLLQIGLNRQVRDVLRAKGYRVEYSEFFGGHHYVQWRASLPEALTAVLAPAGGGGTVRGR